MQKHGRVNKDQKTNLLVGAGVGDGEGVGRGVGLGVVAPPQVSVNTLFKMFDNPAKSGVLK